MNEYTPTTEEVRESYAWSDNALTEKELRAMRKRFNRWLTEMKAEAWEEGALWHRANAVLGDRRMKVRFFSELQAVNPYLVDEEDKDE